MSHRYDAATKHLVETRLPDWLALSRRRSDAPTRVLDADLSTVTADADKVLHVADAQPWLLHLELQSSHDSTLAARLPWYNALLEYRHDLPVWSVVVLLRRESNVPALDGLLERGFAGEPPYRVFRYEVVRVWEMPLEGLLEGGVGTLPLAPLTNEASGRLESVVARMKERLDAETGATEAAVLWTATDVLMGLRYEADLVQQLWRGVRGMRESSTYQAILQEGRQEGQLEHAKQTLLRVGQEALGLPDGSTVARVTAITELSRLDALVVRALRAASWDDLLSTP